MERNPSYARDRLRHLADRMRGLIYPERRPVDKLTVAGPTGRISYAESRKLKYRRAQIGDQFGPTWSTFWFNVAATVPEEWQGRRVDLMWISYSEATLWVDGRSTQGLNFTSGDRPDAVLVENARAQQKLRFSIEMACNTKFGDRTDKPFAHISAYVLDKCEIALFDPVAHEMFYDFYVLQQLEAEFAKDTGGSSDRAFAGELLRELNRFANEYVVEDRTTWASAHEILKALYQRHNGTLSHELSAIGHAHTDTAWLWPIAETARKVTRTLSSQTAYMDRYPDYRFVMSQAVQHDMIKNTNPDLFERMKVHVAQGQLIPEGGTWVEPDCNIPSGESLARQFLFGQRFFLAEYGAHCTVFWNPDVFGYNGQLPQIMRQARIEHFLTQKLSWNRYNRPDHHSFHWQGIDGTKVLVHFPPTDTYNAEASVEDLRRDVRAHLDNDRTRHTYMLFGYGDGGGGPTKQMIEVLERAGDLQGLPKVKMRSPREFFDLLHSDADDFTTRAGELYFEYHRGTYTSHGTVKRNMRKAEFLMHELEFLYSWLAVEFGMSYPHDEINHLWKIVLTNQFHDILPGSSITQVYVDSARDFTEVFDRGEKLREIALAKLAPSAPEASLSLIPSGANETSAVAESGHVSAPELPGYLPLNTTSFARREVVETPDGKLVLVEAPAYGRGRIFGETSVSAPVTIDRHGKNLVLENAYLRATLNEQGDLLSLFDKVASRESLASPGNKPQIYDDHPNDFDAWDLDPFHLETQKDCPPATVCVVERTDALRAEVRFERIVGLQSKMVQRVRLDADSRRLEFHCDIDWDEEHKALKVLFPVAVHTPNMTSEMQFGVAERPTHRSTSFDVARYEVPGHKWSDLSEHGFGVAILTESKYGYSALGNEMRLTLLRAPKWPDPTCDIGHHHFAYAIMPHKGGWQDGGVVKEAFHFNSPVLWATGAFVSKHQAFADIVSGELVLDTIKKSEDSDALIVRLYEPHGGRGEARLRIAAGSITRACRSDILEGDFDELPVQDGIVTVSYRPFEIITLKLS